MICWCLLQLLLGYILTVQRMLLYLARTCVCVSECVCFFFIRFESHFTIIPGNCLCTYVFVSKSVDHKFYKNLYSFLTFKKEFVFGDAWFFFLFLSLNFLLCQTKQKISDDSMIQSGVESDYPSIIRHQQTASNLIGGIHFFWHRIWFMMAAVRLTVGCS